MTVTETPSSMERKMRVDRTDAAGSSRRLFWYGIASTLFWIDPEHEIIGIDMVQRQPLEMGLGHRFRELSYEAAERLEQRPPA